jgi:xanthine dehydrogenase YagS FAD-binding subunit
LEDIISKMKNGIDNLLPQYVVDISALDLNYVTFSESDGLRVGAATPVSTIETDPNVNQYYTALAQAATGHAPGIANQATAAGNVLQEVWCWYLRGNYDCWRNGGTVCYAAEGGDNRYYHSIYGGNLCYAVNPSDVAPALFALDAEVTVAGPSGNKTVTMDQLIPGVSIVDGRVTEKSLRYNELVTEIHIPTPASGTQSAFFKVSDRHAIDFALASAAVSAVFNGSTISSARVVLGGVATKPLRVTAAESYLAGQQLTETVISNAATKALAGATPLTTGTGNAFRVYLAQGAVAKALRSLTP